MKQEYKDHTIELSDDWRFTVTGPAYNGAAWFHALHEAKHDIDARIMALAKEKRAEASVAVHVLDEDGKAVIVRGVHSSQGHLLGPHGTQVYPIHPVLRERLTKLAALREEADALAKFVTPYGCHVRRTYGRIQPDKYEELLQAFVDELAQRAEKAKAL